MRSDLPKEHNSPAKKKIITTLDVFSLVNGLWQQQETTGVPPLGVAGYACAALRKDLYYFGGLCGHGSCYHNSVHHLGTNSRHWTLVRVVSTANAPIEKWGSGMVVLEEDGEALLLVIGGFGNIPSQSDNGCGKYRPERCSGGGWTSEIHLFRPRTGTLLRNILTFVHDVCCVENVTLACLLLNARVSQYVPCAVSADRCSSW